ncbi:hypothetical protein ACFV0G_38970, partial [Kitasatospora sp. NPDC059571]
MTDTTSASTSRTSVAPTGRTEHDLLGERELPHDAYIGIHTLRATENFPLTGIPVSAHPRLVTALAAVKQAAALANSELGLLDAERALAIVGASGDIRARAQPQHVVVADRQG